MPDPIMKNDPGLGASVSLRTTESLYASVNLNTPVPAISGFLFFGFLLGFFAVLGIFPFIRQSKRQNTDVAEKRAREKTDDEDTPRADRWHGQPEGHGTHIFEINKIEGHSFIKPHLLMNW